MMIDGIPNRPPGPSIFTKRTLLVEIVMQIMGISHEQLAQDIMGI
jgi:hypothetical protein